MLMNVTAQIIFLILPHYSPLVMMLYLLHLNHTSQIYHDYSTKSLLLYLFCFFLFGEIATYTVRLLIPFPCTAKFTAIIRSFISHRITIYGSGYCLKPPIHVLLHLKNIFSLRFPEELHLLATPMHLFSFSFR